MSFELAIGAMFVIGVWLGYRMAVDYSEDHVPLKLFGLLLALWLLTAGFFYGYLLASKNFGVSDGITKTILIIFAVVLFANIFITGYYIITFVHYLFNLWKGTVKRDKTGQEEAYRSRGLPK